MQRKVVVALIGALAIATAVLAAETATKKVSLKIEGMNCGMCAQKIETALKAVPGVKEADVSLLNETAEVEAEATVTVAALSEAVNKAGYAVAGEKDHEVAHKGKDCDDECPMKKKGKG
jgi:P-type Cu+ transporter